MRTGFVRGILQSTVATAGKLLRFTASGRSDETIEDREVMQHYGLQSRPLAGAECIILRHGEHFVVIATEDRQYRLELQEGEVCLYTDEGDKIHLMRGKEIRIESGGKVIVDCDDVQLGGDSDLKKLIHEDIITALSAHVHPGVTVGSGSTAAPAAGTFTVAAHATSNTKAK